MGLYTNEEELKRRKLGKAPADAFEKSMSRTPAILRPIIRGGVEAYKYGEEAFGEAAARPTQAGKIGRGLKAAITVPAAALYGAAKGPAKSAKRFVGAVGDVATEFTGGDSTSPSSSAKSAARVATPAARVATQQPTAAQEPTSRAAPSSTAPISRVSPVGVPGSGSITTSSGGAARIDPDTGEITVTGNPLRADSTRLPTNAQRPEERRATRMVTYGGYRLPDRTEEAQSPARVRVSDIAEPKTVGAIPGYRRRVEAVKADMSADQTDAQRTQQQGQFEQGQSQAAAIAMQRQAQQQDQFEQNKALDERRIAGTEQQQQLAADQQEAKLAAEQRREDRTVAKEKEISAARAKFEAADTTAEKVAAAQMLSSLQDMKIDFPTKGKSLDLTPKETSQQVQGALKAFEGAGGEAAAGTDFYTWMRQNDTRGYQAAFGNLTPKDIRVNARINELTDEQLMSSDMAGVMNPGETPAQFRRRLDAEYRSKRGY